jgi:hypothetical protein
MNAVLTSYLKIDFQTQEEMLLLYFDLLRHYVRIRSLPFIE